MGEGEAFESSVDRRHSKVVPGAEALARAGLRQVTLGPKQGLALINGTQVSTAVLTLPNS